MIHLTATWPDVVTAGPSLTATELMGATVMARHTLNSPGRRVTRETLNAYVVTCLVNGKRYVGITSLPVEKRWEKHLVNVSRGRRCRFYSAIRKHGLDAFVIEHIACARSWTDLQLVEGALIEQYGAFYAWKPGGYNMTLGGDGAYGNVMSSEARARIGVFFRGKPRPKEVMARIGAKLKGRILTPEHKERSVAALRAWVVANGPHNKGKPMSDAQRAKLRAAWARGKANGRGKLTEEQRAAKSAHSKAVWAAKTPEQLAAHSERIIRANKARRKS